MADPDSRNSIASFATDATSNVDDDYCNSGLVVSSSARSSALSPSHLMAIQRQQLEQEGDDDEAYAAAAAAGQQKTSRQSECPYVGDGELNGRRLRDESVDESIEELDDEQQQHFMASWMKRYPAPPAAGAGAGLGASLSSSSSSPRPAQSSNASTLSKAPLEEKASSSSHKYATLTVDTLEPDSLYTSRGEMGTPDGGEPFRRNERNRATLLRILAIDPSKQVAEATLSTQPQQCSIKGVQRFPQVRHQNEVPPYNQHIPQLPTDNTSPPKPIAAAGSSGDGAYEASGYATSGSEAAASQTLSPEIQAAEHKLSNDYDDLTYKTAQVKVPKSPRPPRMHLEESIHPYHVTANHRIPQSDSEAAVAALFPLTSPSGSAAASRHFQSGPGPGPGAFYRPPSPASSTCVSCFGVRSKPYNAKLAAIGSLNPRSPASSADGLQQASKSGSPQCKSYHRLALLMALLAAILSLAALAITLLVFLGVLSNAGDDNNCLCRNNNLANLMSNTAPSTTTSNPGHMTTAATTATNDIIVASPAHPCNPCNRSVNGERGIPGIQGPVGPEGTEGPRGPVGVTSVLVFNASQDALLQQCRRKKAGNLRVSSATGLVEQCVTTTTGSTPRSAYQAVQFQCPSDWVQYGNFCFGEAEQASVFNYTSGHAMCSAVPGLFFEAKPLVITSRLMALMAFTLTNGAEIWIGSRTAGLAPEVQVADGVSSAELHKSKLIKDLHGVGCDYLAGFTAPSMAPVVLRGPCDRKRPALCAVHYPHA